MGATIVKALLMWFAIGMIVTFLLHLLLDRSLVQLAMIAFGFALIPVLPDLIEKKD
tara:strand:- start:135 stop:302 length:168 start_codon:yes stop_codon:yes gene_type:complete